MTARRMVVAETWDDILGQAIDLTRRAGARSFELSYDSTERHLGDGEEPRPDEPVRWTVIAEMPTPLGVRDVVGTAISPSGNSTHSRAICYALARLIESLGANLVLVDPSNEPEPAR